ncbi:SDR family NAD(P)-dependent oxidoreductase [Subtercola boreus]|uniref:Short-chain dehydrogenase n=1 Tax=Subtercola boreus TaxID=120213 RepID=A0A3E0WB24_9MICO|nr:SDR family NAD(P)-dependent oxidoreductase [Subtercola boreus]RFA21050.1 short-chain dehydrogenase [Subtercola boreus]RFA21434.1 short-chain dehydrogenase [Subtercola boreus]RFA27405.1 short-chain dehydrogenase [Subtercola boreus]
MPQRTVVITGASDGIGAAAARALKRRGDDVVIVGRSPAKTKAVADELAVPYYLADYARLDDVHALAATLLENHPRIDILANNAGGLMSAREETVDGLEKTMQVNHFAPFLLTNLLLDRLTASQGVVINTASVANSLYGKIDIDDLNLRQKYTPNLAYGNAKLSNILFTRELDRLHAADGIATAAFHPGIVGTSFAAGSTSNLRFVYRTVLGRLMMSPEKGSDTLVWLASTEPAVDWVPGQYYERRKIQRATKQAYDSALATQLWETSARMVGLP